LIKKEDNLQWEEGNPQCIPSEEDNLGQKEGNPQQKEDSLQWEEDNHQCIPFEEDNLQPQPGPGRRRLVGLWETKRRQTRQTNTKEKMKEKARHKLVGGAGVGEGAIAALLEAVFEVDLLLKHSQKHSKISQMPSHPQSSHILFLFSFFVAFFLSLGLLWWCRGVFLSFSQQGYSFFRHCKR